MCSVKIDAETRTRINRAGLDPSPGSNGGLGFSEFIELVGAIALAGMGGANSYNGIYPTPFSKVLAILTVWGLADLKSLDEVRAISSKNMQADADV